MKEEIKKLERKKISGTSVPSYTGELRTRISSVVQKIGGLKKSAQYAGVTDETLAAWRDGKSEPRFFGLQGLAEAAGKSLDWLATGVEKERSPSNDDFFSIPRYNACLAAGDGALPVFGMAACGPSGWAVMENSALRAVPSFNLGPNAFAVILTGESLQPFGMFEGSLCYCDPEIPPQTGNIVCLERIHQDGSVHISIKKIGIETTDTFEIFGFKGVSENGIRETQEIFWEIVKKDEIQRISVVTMVSLRPHVS